MCYGFCFNDVCYVYKFISFCFIMFVVGFFGCVVRKLNYLCFDIEGCCKIVR